MSFSMAYGVFGEVCLIAKSLFVLVVLQLLPRLGRLSVNVLA